MPARAKPVKPMLLNLPLDKARWLQEQSEVTGESKTFLIVSAIAAEMRKQARIERRAQREAAAR